MPSGGKSGAGEDSDGPAKDAVRGEGAAEDGAEEPVIGEAREEVAKGNHRIAGRNEPAGKFASGKLFFFDVRAEAVFVKGGSGGDVPGGSLQFLRKDVSASHGERGALARKERYAVAGVTKKDDAAVAPMRRFDLRDLIEVEAAGLDPVEEPGHNPADAGECGAELFEAGRQVQSSRRTLSAVKEKSSELAAADGIEANLAAGNREGGEGVAGRKAGGESGEDISRRVIAEEAQETRFFAESERADAGVNAVGPDEEIGMEGGAVREMDDNFLGMLFDGVDGDAEAEASEVLHVRVEDAFEIAAKEIEVTIVENLAHGGIGDSKFFTASRVDERELVDGIVDLLNIGEKAEAFGGVVTGANEIDHVAFGADRRGLFDERAGISGATAAVREGETGNAGA